MSIELRVKQAMADLSEAETELWAEASVFVAAENLSDSSRRLAEAAFKAGLSAGAGWAINYVRKLQEAGA